MNTYSYLCPCIVMCIRIHDLLYSHYSPSGEFSKRVQNTVGKGEIAHLEQFLLISQCFRKMCTTDTQTRTCLGKVIWVNHTIPSFNYPKTNSF